MQRTVLLTLKALAWGCKKPADSLAQKAKGSRLLNCEKNDKEKAKADSIYKGR